MADVQFFYDLGSPYSYLSALRVDEAFAGAGAAVDWVPVLLGGVFAATGRSSWSLTEHRAAGIAEVERRAAERGVPRLVWPGEWPNDGLNVMRAACWATLRDGGRVFALAAFAEQFARGNALSDPAHVANAARRAGYEPDQVLAATGDPAVKAALRENTERALAVGVIGVPSFAVDGEIWWGDDRLDAAVATLTRTTRDVAS